MVDEASAAPRPLAPPDFAYPFSEVEATRQAVADLVRVVDSWRSDLELVGEAGASSPLSGRFAQRFRSELAMAVDDLSRVRALVQGASEDIDGDLAMARRVAIDHEEAWRRHRVAVADWRRSEGRHGA